MQLNIANCSKQHVDFIYRVPEDASLKRQHIPAGGQIRVLADHIQPEVADNIIKQHERYGLVRASEIDRTKPFVGLCYDVDKPVQVNKFMYAEEHNGAVLTKASQDARQLSAAALHKAMEATSDGAKIDSLEVTVLEQNGPTERGLNEAVTVSRDPGKSQSRRGKRAT